MGLDIEEFLGCLRLREGLGFDPHVGHLSVRYVPPGVSQLRLVLSHPLAYVFRQVRTRTVVPPRLGRPFKLERSKLTASLMPARAMEASYALTVLEILRH